MTVVQKYGGSSVADTEKIKRVAMKIKDRTVKGDKVVVVVSAMGKTTDNLIKLAGEVSSVPDPREMDMLLTTGEQISVALLSMSLKQAGVHAISINAFQAGIMTTSDFNCARIKNFDIQKIKKLLLDYDVVVVTGFQGINDNGDLTTLGRGGSDTSAVALAAALEFNCEIYSDVKGIYTVDPKLHPAAKKLKSISYDEILEMANSGAKVLHDRSVEIAKKYGVVLYCAGTFSEEEGTYVMQTNIEDPVVSGLSVMENQTRVVISNLPLDYKLVHKIFERVAKDGLNVDMISIIGIDEGLKLSFTVIQEYEKKLEDILEKFLIDFKNCNVTYEKGFTKVSVVGIGMKTSTGVASSFFKAMDSVPVKLVTTSDIKISCLIENRYKDDIVNALVKEFDL
ncbi:MAG TPA: aspartate kinase [Petrotogaceae bacterium]|nr:aspartate kinase [Petrotogaceae bacterium]HQO13119.1 aspartate kinase [Petrotogaceae bacterium]HQP58370.1 aspartate kinase [Petrotogaceae bacterium]